MRDCDITMRRCENTMRDRDINVVFSLSRPLKNTGRGHEITTRRREITMRDRAKQIIKIFKYTYSSKKSNMEPLFLLLHMESLRIVLNCLHRSKKLCFLLRFYHNIHISAIFYGLRSYLMFCLIRMRFYLLFIKHIKQNVSYI